MSSNVDSLRECSTRKRAANAWIDTICPVKKLKLYKTLGSTRIFARAKVNTVLQDFFAYYVLEPINASEDIQPVARFNLQVGDPVTSV